METDSDPDSESESRYHVYISEDGKYIYQYDDADTIHVLIRVGGPYYNGFAEETGLVIHAPLGHVGGTTVKNAKPATCTEAGYTGDTVCNDCNAVLQEGTVIEKLLHTDKDKNSLCDSCGKVVGELGYKLTTEVSYDRYWLAMDISDEELIIYYNPETGIFSACDQDESVVFYQYNTITDEVEIFVYDWDEDDKSEVKFIFDLYCNKPMPLCNWRLLYYIENCPNTCTEWYFEFELKEDEEIDTVEYAVISEDGKYIYYEDVNSEGNISEHNLITVGGYVYNKLVKYSGLALHAPIGHTDENHDGKCDRCGEKEEHDHTYGEWKITKKATCTEIGTREKICSVCSDTVTETIDIDSSNHVGGTSVKNKESASCEKAGYTGDTVCNDCNAVLQKGTSIDPLDHELVTYTQSSTCKVQGYTITTCSRCDEELGFEVLPFADHTWGEWKVIKEATTLAEGKEERTCSVCGKTETQPIPMLPTETKTKENEKTGISVTYTEDGFDGDIEVEVKEEYTGTQFLGSSYGKFNSWNIKISLDGKEVQPNKPVYVRIPIPADFNRKSIAVYHIDTATGKSERMDITIEDDYICFYATSFSPYVIVDESTEQKPSANCSCACHSSGINNFFWRIANFFHKLFKMNQYRECKCGKAHW